jgi:PAS domain S-box-containing protein
LVELTNRALVAVLVADHVGLIAHVDAPLAQALGWCAHELVGRPLATIIPPHLQDAHHLGFSRFLTTHQPMVLERRLTLSVATRAGTELSAEHVITAIRIETGWLFAAAIRMQDSHAG